MSFRVQRTWARILWHLSHDSLTQMPHFARSIFCCSAVILISARSPHTAQDFWSVARSVPMCARMIEGKAT
jgi:hypothetical protein